MNLSSSQVNKLNSLTHEELLVECTKHVHRNPVEEAYGLAIAKITAGRTLLATVELDRKLDRLLALLESPPDQVMSIEEFDRQRLAVGKKAKA
jgi:hypothetical protein